MSWFFQKKKFCLMFDLKFTLPYLTSFLPDNLSGVKKIYSAWIAFINKILYQIINNSRFYWQVRRILISFVDRWGIFPTSFNSIRFVKNLDTRRKLNLYKTQIAVRGYVGFTETQWFCKSFVAEILVEKRECVFRILHNKQVYIKNYKQFFLCNMVFQYC